MTYIISAAASPLIAWIHGSWEFDALFRLLAVSAGLIFFAVFALPKEGLSAKQTVVPGGELPEP